MISLIKMEEQQPNNLKSKLMTFINECVRVVKVTKKPTGYEFKTTAKVAGLGLAAIGAIGFILNILRELLFKQ